MTIDLTNYSLLSNINTPEDLRLLSKDKLTQMSEYVVKLVMK